MRIIGSVLLLTAVALSVRADEKPKEASPGEKKPAAASAFKELQAEYNKQQQELITAYRAAKTDAERQEALKKRPDDRTFVDRALKLAKDDPKGVDAPEALMWAVQMSRLGPVGKQALDTLLADHLDHPKLGQLAPALVYSADRVAAEAALRKMLQQSPHAAVQGSAAFFLAQLLKNELERPGADAKRGAEAEELLERVATKYAKEKAYGETLGDLAKRELFEIRNLAIGKTAPEIAGEDIDGKKFKLSDYRGKVVVIDFWGHW